MYKFILMLLFLPLVTGCARGPGEEELRKVLETSLEKRFIPGLFELKSFSRRGHQPYTSEDNKISGIIVYYKATLVFNRDYELSGWDGYGAGSLISILGATPAGITGIEAGGNQQGDKLSVYGLMAFREYSGDWQPTSYLSDDPGTDNGTKAKPYLAEDDVAEEKYFSATPSWQQRLTKELSQALIEFEKQDDRQNLHLLKADIEALITRSRTQQAHNNNRKTLLSGSPSGNYYAIGKGLEKLFAKDKTIGTDVIPSSGAISNLEMIREGLADFALTQNDLAEMSFQGEGLFAGHKNTQLRALSTVYPEALQIVVHRDSGIERVADLARKRVNIGAPGSGGRINAIQVLESYNIDYSGFSGYDMETAVSAFREGRLDALMLMTGFPSKTIEGLGEGVTLLDMTKERVESLITEHNFIALQVPAGSYPGLYKDINTVGVTAILVTRADVPLNQANQVLQTLYNNVSELSRSTLLANYIDPDKATRGIRVPLHPATRALLESN